MYVRRLTIEWKRDENFIFTLHLFFIYSIFFYILCFFLRVFFSFLFFHSILEDTFGFVDIVQNKMFCKFAYLPVRSSLIK